MATITAAAPSKHATLGHGGQLRCAPSDKENRRQGKDGNYSLPHNADFPQIVSFHSLIVNDVWENSAEESIVVPF
jgi:hypothetical protein